MGTAEESHMQYIAVICHIRNPFIEYMSDSFFAKNLYPFARINSFLLPVLFSAFLPVLPKLK
jgi:hypothetical protein